MAEKEVVYKPVIDLSELPGQLQEIQSQLDLMMGAASFSASTPVNQPFSQSAASALGGFASQVTSLAGQGFDASYNANLAIMQQFNEVGEAARLGAYKFHSALNMQGLMQPLGDFLQPNLAMDSVNNPSFSDAGYFKSGFGMMGWGYDPNTAGMTEADYQDAARARFRSMGNFGNLAGDVLGLGLGTTAGFLTGNPAIGFAVDFAVDATVGAVPNYLNRHNIEQERLAGFIRGGSFRQAGGPFTQNQSLAIASNLQDMFDSAGLEKMGLDQFQAESLVHTYAANGGFDAVRSAEEYTTQVRELLSNSQRVAQLLRTSLSEAGATLGRLAGAGVIDSPGDAMGLALDTSANAKVAGLTTNEYLNLGMAGAAMVQGTGLDFATGFQGMQAAQMGLRHGLSTGGIDMNLVRHAGGMQNAAGIIMQAGIDYGNSPMGMVMQAAGLPIGSNINDLLGTAAMNVRTPDDILSLIGGRNNYIDSVGTEALAAGRMQHILQQMNMLNLDTGNIDGVVGYMMTRGYAKTEVEARTMMSSLLADPGGDLANTVEEARRVNAAAKPGFFGKLRNAYIDLGDNTTLLNTPVGAMLFGGKHAKRGMASLMNKAARATGFLSDEIEDMFFDSDEFIDDDPTIGYEVLARGGEAGFNELFAESLEFGTLAQYDSIAKKMGQGSGFEMFIKTHDLDNPALEAQMRKAGISDIGIENVLKERGSAYTSEIIRGQRSTISAQIRTRMKGDLKATFAGYDASAVADPATRRILEGIQRGEGTAAHVKNLITNLRKLDANELDPNSVEAQLSRSQPLHYVLQSMMASSTDDDLMATEQTLAQLSGKISGSDTSDTYVDFNTIDFKKHSALHGILSGEDIQEFVMALNSFTREISNKKESGSITQKLGYTTYDGP